MTEPKVSIIIPVYNVEKYLKRCLDSLTNQTLSEIEIILIDDSSTDNSSALCDEAAKNDSRIKVIHKKNEGAGLARNAGLEIATGKYVGFVDSDDYVATDMFKRLYDTAEKTESELVMSGFRFVGGNMFSEEGEIVPKYYFEKDTFFEGKDELKGVKLGIVGACPEEPDDSRYGMSVWKNLFRNDIIRKNGLRFESEREMLSEDALFMIDYISCIKKAVGIKDTLYYYCRNEESISKSYKKDRLEKGLVFINQAELRFSSDIMYDEYIKYLDRFWQAFCRVMCSQLIMYAENSGMEYPQLKKELKYICTNARTVQVFKRYPIGSIPLKQRVFAFLIKHRMYLLQKIMVKLRSR